MQIKPRVLRLKPNTEGRDILVGDVHGCFSKLQAALDGIAFNADVDRLICCGDLVDRGPESERASAWLRLPWLYCVPGNHEQLAIMYAEDPGIGPFYAQCGGAWFMLLPEARQAALARQFAALPVAIELETPLGLVVVVHADMPTPTWAECRERLASPDPARAEAAVKCMLWGRDRFNSKTDWGPVPDVRAVVVGHTPVSCHTTLDNVHYIDGGAWLPAHRGPRPFILMDAATLTPLKYDAPTSPDWS